MLVLTDCRIGENCLDSLKNHGFEVILMPPAENLQSGVASHTDMLIFVGFGKLFSHRDYYKSHSELISLIAEKTGNEPILSDEEWSPLYPHDVLFNACVVGNNLICNEKTVSRHILESAKQNGYKIINVSQGYTKCSICAVSDNAIITADKSISAACEGAGMDVLSVTAGHISLPPYSYGFIGGASGTCGDKVYFCGSLDTHPDGDKIKEFCKKHGKIAISLGNGKLEDVGSLLFV